MSKFILCSLVLTLFAISTVQAAYDQTMATTMARYAFAAYCETKDLSAMACTNCKSLAGTTFSYQNTVKVNLLTTVSYSIFINAGQKRVVASFRGTNNIDQLLAEFIESRAITCSICKNNLAVAVDYFLMHYVQYLQKDFLNQMQSLSKNFPTYDFYVTGHSLGGAFATLATLDIGSHGFVPKNRLRLYTYGSPRVGDINLVNEVLGYVIEAYRITHNRDIVPHVPPCIEGPHSECLSNAAHGNENNNIIFNAWHTNPEIFYTEDFKSYKVCTTSEDKTCSDQFGYTKGSVADHLNYLGVTSACV